MSRIVEPGICDCSCHNPDSHSLHGFPCCVGPCPVCKQNVERGCSGEEHVKACQKRLDDLIKQHEAANETHDVARSQGEF